jgi:hypothetical protein
MLSKQQQEYYYKNYYEPKGMSREQYEEQLSMPQQKSYEIDFYYERQKKQITDGLPAEIVDKIKELPPLTALETWFETARQNGRRERLEPIIDDYNRGKKLTIEQMQELPDLFPK